MRRPRAHHVVGLLLLAATARAQTFVQVTVSGATEESRAFTALYKNADGASSQWSILGPSLAVYRVTQPAGTVTISVMVPAGLSARLANGPTGRQTLSLQTTFSGTPLASMQGLPNEPLQIQYEFPYSNTGVARTAFVVSVGPVPARCGLGNVACIEIPIYLAFLLRDVPTLGYGGSVRPPIFVRPLPTFFQMGLLGVNPLTDVTDVSIDGVSATRTPSGVVPLNQSPGAGRWDRYPQDPVRPEDVIFPGAMDPFLGCGGAGCGSPGVRVGLPENLGPGEHHIRVSGPAYASGVFTAFGSNSTVDIHGTASLDLGEDFIFLDPKLEISPATVEPGATLTVSGTGFAPENQIPLKTHAYCCGGGTSLGSARSDLRGSFTFQTQLPPVTAPPFAGIWLATQPPGSRADGTVTAEAGDAAFVQRYGVQGYKASASITFVKPGATPGTTTTTLPGAGCTSDAACDDGDPCTVDACSGGRCSHTPLGGAAGVRCAVPPQGIGAARCTVQSVPPPVGKSFDKATGFLDRAIGKSRGAVRKLVKKADKFLKKAKHLTQVAELSGTISSDCADDIVNVIDGVRGHVGTVLKNL